MNKNKITGIYMIKCTQTKRFRIGGATDIMKRFSNYKSRLSSGLGNERMVEDVVNYGLDSFEFIVLEECSVEDLFKLESKYMNLYSDCLKDGYNSNRVRKREKFIRNLDEQREYKEKRSKITSGELNGHCTVLDQEKANEILWLKLNTKMKYKDIAELYGTTGNMVSRIMKDRWMQSIPVMPVNFIESEVM